MWKGNLSGQDFLDSEQNKIDLGNSFFFLFSFSHSPTCCEGPKGSALLEGQYLEEPGVEEERVGSLCVIVAVQVEIAEFVQVPVQGNKLSHRVQR